eukprot:2542459-Amphidinium_carterae.1
MEGSESEREQALADVKRDGMNLRNVPKRYKADHEIVLKAVHQNGRALHYAAEVTNKKEHQT